jgi:colanic acid/amylovoran biosynthesis glycosyltransferase
MILCIAAWRFDRVPETFIRDHVRSIAPGSTILVCQDRNGTEQFGCPVLAKLDSWSPPRSSKQRVDLSKENRSRLRAFLETNHANAMLAEYGPNGCLLARACDQAGVPLYVHFHGYDAARLIRNARQVRHYRAMFRSASGIIAPSRFLANRLKEIGCPSAKLYVSPYGVDPERFKPSRRIPERAVAVGRLVEKKAPHLTIEAFARIVRRFPKAQLDFVGGGELEESCRALICDRGLSRNVYMHGAQGSDFVVGLLQEASLFVQHSVTARDGDTEGLPVGILEAMASALPVVSTRHSGIPEAILHNVTGQLVDEHDVEGMADAMIKMFDYPERAAMMGAAGRERILVHFTHEKARDRLRAIIGFPPLSAKISPRLPGVRGK